MELGSTYQITELGKFRPDMRPVDQLGTGEVGYVIANIRTSAMSISATRSPTMPARPRTPSRLQAAHADGLLRLLPGNNTEYPRLRASFERLALNDASFSFVPQNSQALGFGFRCGFLGLLHMEIIQERLERENDIDVVQTPRRQLRAAPARRTVKRIDSPASCPTARWWKKSASLRPPGDHHHDGHDRRRHEARRGPPMQADQDDYLNPTRVMLDYKAPLAEIVYDFYDQIKGIITATRR